MNFNSRIYVAGHTGMVGSAIIRALEAQGCSHIIKASSSSVDLRNQHQVQHFFNTHKPEYVFLAAAKVGGIHANNTLRADFLYDNLMIQSNVIHEAYRNNVKKLLFLGSSCIYPKQAPQPLREEYLLTAALEPTNEPYALAKIAGIKLCENYRLQYGCDFISVMPANLYGPNDTYHLQHAHVLPTLIRKCHEAKIKQQNTIELWGSGTPMREFLHVDDLAQACLFLMQQYSNVQHINVGTGIEISIAELAQTVANIVGYTGSFYYNSNMPDGTMRKVMDSSKLQSLGWHAQISLSEGIKNVYEQYIKGEAVKAM